MRDNEETVLVGSKVVLVPYRGEHVERYHAWMKDPEIREQTASEPLSLEEEYEMQASWHKDSDKLTFIVLARDGPASQDYSTAEEAMAQAEMAGDINLFLSERQSDEDDDDDDGQVSAQLTEESPNGRSPLYDAELEVMIAEPRFRRKGLGREALGLLMYYATMRPSASRQHSSQKLDTEIGDKVRSGALPLPIDAFVAKVGIDNVPSLRMFESMGFHEVHRSTVWREAELRPDPARLDILRASIIAPRQVLHWRQ